MSLIQSHLANMAAGVVGSVAVAVPSGVTLADAVGIDTPAGQTSVVAFVMYGCWHFVRRSNALSKQVTVVTGKLDRLEGVVRGHSGDCVPRDKLMWALSGGRSDDQPEPGGAE